MLKNITAAEYAFMTARVDGLEIELRVWDSESGSYIATLENCKKVTAIQDLCRMYGADVWQIDYMTFKLTITLIRNGLTEFDYQF